MGESPRNRAAGTSEDARERAGGDGVKTVLIADDSATARLLLTRIVAEEPGMRVIGEACDGAEAVQLTRALRPDVVLMDVQMPGMDGFEATRQIMTDCPTPIVIVTTSLAFNEVEVSMNALRNGALIALQKPTGPGTPDYESRTLQFRRMLRLMAEVRVHRRLFTRTPKPFHHSQRSRPPSLVAIAASTGGPAAILAVLEKLPAKLPAPVVVVQHIARGFAEGFARWLDGELALTVRVAQAGEAMRAGMVYIAPDDAHLGVEPDGTLRLEPEANALAYRPSADYLFRSVAAAYPGCALAVILTGMGNDGEAGLQAVRKANGWIIAQDESTSVVYSMPRAAVEAGLADEVLPVDAIGDAILAQLRVSPAK